MAIVIEQQIHAQDVAANFVTTSAFTPAADHYVVAKASINGGSADHDQHIAFTDSLSGTWTELIARSRHSDGDAAYPPPLVMAARVGAGTSMTVTATATGNAGGDVDLHVWVLSGVDLTNPVVITAELTQDLPASLSLNTAGVDGAMALAGVVDWFATGDPTNESGTTTDNSHTFTSDNSCWSGHKPLTTGGANTVGTASPATPHNNAVAVAIRPGVAGSAAPARIQYPPQWMLRILIAANARDLQTVVGDVTQTVDATDSMGLTDSAGLDMVRTTTDTMGLVDSVGLTVGAGVTDSMGLTDSALAEVAKVVAATDTMGLVDAATFAVTKPATDTMGLVDSAALAVAVPVTDSMGLTDSAGVTVVHPIDATDSMGLTDTAFPVVSKVVTVTDTMGLVDSAALAVAKPATDSMGLVDSAALAVAKPVTDSMGLTDSAVFSEAKPFTDSMGLTDSAGVVPVHFVNATDSMGLTDNLVSQTGAGSIFLPTGLIPIRALTAEEILTGNRSTSIRYDLYSRAEAPLGDLVGVEKGSVDYTSSASIHGGGALEIADIGQSVDWLNDRVRPVIIIEGLPEEPLGMFVFSEAPEEWGDTGRTWPVKLMDKTAVLDEDAVDATYSLDAGTVVTTTIVSLIASTGETNIAITPSAAVLANPLAWDPGTTKLKIVNDLLKVIGYFSLFCDRNGQFRGEPYTRPANRPILYEFLDGNTSIYDPNFVKDVDLLGIPNKFVAVGRGDADTAALVGVATNTDPASPYSYPSRNNRWITKSVTGIEAVDQATLDEYAARRLIELTSPTSSVDVSHAFVPGLSFNNAVRLRRVPAGIDARHVITKTLITLDPVALVRSTLQEVVDL